MGKGEADMDARVSDWIPIPPGSNVKTHWKFACRERLAYVSSSAAAEWIPISGNPERGISVFADPATIRKSGNIAKMMVLFDHKTAQRIKNVQFIPRMQFMSRMGQYEYDCKGKQHNIVYASLYSGNMGRGRVIFSFDANAPVNWLPFPPNSISAALLKFACGQGDTK